MFLLEHLDPAESFLRTLAQQAGTLQFYYPVSRVPLPDELQS